MVGAMLDGPHEEGFLGSSSAANFIKHVKQVIDAKVYSPDDSIDLCILNIVFALASQLSPTVKLNQ